MRAVLVRFIQRAVSIVMVHMAGFVMRFAREAGAVLALADDVRVRLAMFADDLLDLVVAGLFVHAARMAAAGMALLACARLVLVVSIDELAIAVKLPVFATSAAHVSSLLPALRPDSSMAPWQQSRPVLFR